MSIIKIKRSAATATPTSLEQGELAYSELSGKLFIGVSGPAIEEVGGDFFTALLNSTAGTLTASKAVIVDANKKIDDWLVDNIQLDGNTVSATNTNGNLILAANGTGTINLSHAMNAGSNLITNVATPVSAADAATKAYVDSVATGLDVKESVRVASTADIDLGVAADPSPVDGVTLANGDRILLKNQTAAAENGIYVAVTATDPTTWTRSTDMDDNAEVTAGVFTFVEEGTANADTGWVVVTDNPITVGTTAINWSQFTGAASIVGGAGLTKTGNTLDVNVDNSTIEINADTLRVKDAGITNAKLANSAITVAGDTGSDGVALGETLTFDGTDGLNAAVATNTVTLSINNASIANAKLANSTITITGDSGTDAIALGETLTIDGTDGISAAVATNTITLSLTNSSIANAKLANSTITVAGDSGSDAVALGETLTFDGQDGISAAVATNTVTLTLGTVDGGTF